MAEELRMGNEGSGLMRYRLLKRLGQGGMGIVHRAEHRETGQLVALKTVRLPDASLLSSIRREIHALSRIRHPRIVRIVDHGVCDGLPWYAMELLEGVTLRRWAAWSGSAGETRTSDQPSVPEQRSTRALAADEEAVRDDTAAPDGQRPPPEPSSLIDRVPAQLPVILSLVRRLCAPLAYLHGEGIVHRDLKPENILVQPDATPVIVDFGLSARFAGETSRETLAIEGSTVGTVSYMAPEQIRGEIVDARADLYALGCILYELLTGRCPFVSASPFEILNAHQFQAPKSLRHHNAEIPPELDELVLRLLAKQPRERLGHADVVAHALVKLGAAVDPDDSDPAPQAYLFRPGLFGRAAEVAVLRDQVRRLEEGRGAIVLLGGESGVGKTRLVTELAREAVGRGVLVLGGECLEVGGSALQPFRKPLQAIADRCREQGREETERLLGPRAKLLALFAPELAALPGQEAHPEPAELPAEAARLRILTYLVDTFAALAADRDVLLALDDLQWADPLSLEVLALLLRTGRLDRFPLLVLGTYRAEEVGESLGRLLGMAAVRRIVVERLEERSVAAMVGDMLALSPPPTAFAAYLGRHSEGNPFFVAEYLRLAVDEGVLSRNPRGTWQLAAGIGAVTGETEPALPIPRSLRELVGRRLGGLSAAAARLVEAAAVLGREAEVLLLGEMTGLEEEDLVGAAGELVRRQIVEERTAGELRFLHDKLREVAYQLIAERRRPGLHRAAAAEIEALHAAKREELLAELGRHWRAAGERRQASACFLGAARRARERWTLAAAVPLYEACLELAEEPTTASVAAQVELAGEVLLILGRYPEAERTLGQALEAARGIGDRRGEATAAHHLGRLYCRQSRGAEGRKLLEQALALHRAHGDRRHEGITLDALAHLVWLSGSLAEACAIFEQVQVIDREVGNRRAEAVTAGHLGGLYCEQGRMAEGRELFERALALHREVGNRCGEGISLNDLALLDREQGRLDEAWARLEQALAIHCEIGNRKAEANTLGELGALHRLHGRMAEADELWERALARFREIGDRRGEANGLFALGGLHCEQGRMAEGRTLFEQSLALHREVGNRRYEGHCLVDLAGYWYRLACGDLSLAQELTAHGETILREVGARIDRTRVLCQRGHLELAAGRPAQALLDASSELAAAGDAGPESDVGRFVARLRRAQEAFLAGEHQRLFRGQLIADLTAGQRRWLVEHGQLERERAMLSDDPPTAAAP
ncbi:MAG: tetratricopeptide repeat protein [Candidatus Schekmanbacteria bacterium]|nr:tetratricopeptide repeat protein [Candidatus Schekmanbacteria bacterium]